MKRFAIAVALFLFSAGSAFAGDTYDYFKEQLASVRDSYVTCVNMAMEDATSGGDPAGWFWMRSEGLAATWKDLDFEPPESIFKIKEILYGFHLSGGRGSYWIDADVVVWTRDSDIQYTITYRKDTTADAKLVAKEVFVNEQSDYPVKCSKGAVACYNGKSTFGKLKK